MPDPSGSAFALCPSLADELAEFDEFGTPTTVSTDRG